METDLPIAKMTIRELMTECEFWESTDRNDGDLTTSEMNRWDAVEVELTRRVLADPRSRRRLP